MATAPTQAAPLQRGRRDAEASATATSPIIAASEWPPPAKCRASSGFQPTSAVEKAERVDQATTPTIPSIDAAASTRKKSSAVLTEVPATFADASPPGTA